MAKSKLAKEERERFRQMPEGDLLELRSVLSKQIQVLVNEKNAAVGSIHRINKELENRQHDDAERVVVTDHAVVRYLERTRGLDVESVRKEIADMARRSVRRDEEFMDDPVTGMIVVRRHNSDSVATIMEPGAVKR